MKERLIERVGEVTELCISWQNGTPCKAYKGAHGATAVHPSGTQKGLLWEFSEPLWPDACEHCGIPVPKAEVIEGTILLSRWTRTNTIFNTASGEPEKGDAYWQTHESGDCPYWTNCDGRHLNLILPDGRHWDCMWRASNCTLKEDRLHRCWVVHTLPDGTHHVDKAGHTCGAGAGSFASEWHGFLTKGFFVPA